MTLATTASSSAAAAVALRRSLVASHRAATQARYQSTTASQSSSSSSSSNDRASSSSSSSSSSRLPPSSLPPTPSALLTGSTLAPSRLKPLTPAFYTARPSYISLLLQLEDLLRKSKRALEQLHVLKGNAPMPSLVELADLLGERKRGASATSVGPAPSWQKIGEMGSLLGMPLKASQYRNIATALSSLARYAPLVKVHLPTSPKAEHQRLANEVDEIMEVFKRRTGAADQRADRVTPGTGVDTKGRIWANGRRKESTAMVWIAPLEAQPAGSSNVASSIASAPAVSPPLGEVMVNGFPISKYFTRTTHREDILHPLRLVNLLGAFNIFALVSGGGHTGQSGAVAHGLAKALVRFFEEKLAKASESGKEAEEQEWARLRISVREVLGRDGVLKRDPRMVERKKTGLAKARKAYTWVKR